MSRTSSVGQSASGLFASSLPPTNCTPFQGFSEQIESSVRPSGLHSESLFGPVSGRVLCRLCSCRCRCSQVCFLLQNPLIKKQLTFCKIRQELGTGRVEFKQSFWSLNWQFFSELKLKKKIPESKSTKNSRSRSQIRPSSAKNRYHKFTKCFSSSFSYTF